MEINKYRENIPVGISSCLMGHKVRHDGGHKNFGFAMNQLQAHFNFEIFFPETDAGMSVPRPAIHQINSRIGVRVVEAKDPKNDVTEALLEASKMAIANQAHLAGYILKKDSPSCGTERVRVYNSKGQSEKNRRELFTKTLSETYPNLPMEEEGRLMDPVLRENFIERVFTYQRWLEFSANGFSVRGLIGFHTRHKFNILSHNLAVYRQLGLLVVGATKQNLQSVCERYISSVMTALIQPANRRTHTNVLMPLMAYFKAAINSEEKQELRKLLDNYRLGLIPLIVPITMLKHYLNRSLKPYLISQTLS